MAETDMWSAVVYQAICDLDTHLRLLARGDEAPDRNSSATFPSTLDGEEARAFLLAKHGPWARSRMDICYISGIDPDVLRERVEAAIEKDGHLQSLRLEAMRMPTKRKERNAA